MNPPAENRTQPGHPTYPDLVGKVAVVTGSSHGIGATTCRWLAANGAKVVVNGRDRTAVDSLVGTIRSSGGQAIGVAADCTDLEAVERMQKQAEGELGPVDLLAAFVGGGGEPVPTVDIGEEDWRRLLDVNLTATFLTVRSFLPGMIARRRGAVVTMASTAGRQPGGASAAYAAAKAGVVMFTRHVANEVGPHGVRVNCVAPSIVLTERHPLRGRAEVQQQVAASIPLRRLGTPDDVALATLFLFSESAAWLTGVTLDVTGGRVTG
jgi:3-oxoacyl-[acyl-carrier protein] reductase